jgi:hypothetical protein
VGAPDPARSEFAGLLAKAEAKYAAWHLKELRPERDNRLNELKRQHLTSGQRAVYAFRIYRELLEREVRQRIAFYSEVAHEPGHSEMLAKPRLDEVRQLFMTSVRHAVAALKDRTLADIQAAGEIPEIALPNESRYTHMEAQILDVINSELNVLEVEGRLVQPAESAPFPGEGKTPATGWHRGTDRQRAVDEYIANTLEKTGKRIARAHIWRKAGDKNRTEFYRWESYWYEKHGKPPNAAANQRFTRVLSKPYRE